MATATPALAQTLRIAGYASVPLPGFPWSPAFMAAYTAARSGETAGLPKACSPHRLRNR